MVGVLGGVLAGASFKQIWKLAAREDDAPKATDAQAGLGGGCLSAAALQGAVYGVVKAAIDRGAAEGTLRLTGFLWPGENGEQKKVT